MQIRIIKLFYQNGFLYIYFAQKFYKTFEKVVIFTVTKGEETAEQIQLQMRMTCLVLDSYK